MPSYRLCFFGSLSKDAKTNHFVRAKIGSRTLKIDLCVVPNTYKNNPSRLAEWASASHVEKHAPVPNTPITPTPPPVTPVRPPVTPPNPTTS
jgi:hypothetical protein